MNTNDIQKRLDAMPAAMTAKGLKRPNAAFTLSGNEGFSGRFMWDERKNGSSYQFSHHKGETPEDILASMESWIAALPTREEAHMRNFMEALGGVIEQGRANGIEVAFINPLTETMKRLSENALTYQKAAAE